MTVQMHENLILNGNEITMAFCPPLPKNTKLLVELNDEEAQQAVKKHKHGDIIFSTACWRGYMGTWEIIDNKFYLKDIIGRYQKTTDDPIFADWFTGVLRIPQGELLQGIHMGFASVYEKELHIKIDKGVVVKQAEIDNTNKNINRDKLAMSNLPGGENKFDGDDL